MAQPESRLSRAIMNELRTRGVFCFKVHGGPTMMAGLPDIVACVPASILTFDDYESDGFQRPSGFGLFVGFETKTPTGGHPTPIQQRVHERIGWAYGRVFVVRSVQDAVDALESMGYPIVPIQRG